MTESTEPSKSEAPTALLADGTPFRHMHSGHCESGVTAALLSHRGLEISEAMIFGIGSGLGFFFPPLIKIMGMPLVSFRSYPGEIFKLACKRLGTTIEQRSFRSPKRAVAELDALLASGEPVGIRTNMFWLSYFPREFRSQFNGHNLIAVRRDGDTYTLSDPVLAEPVTIDEVALSRARFAKGALAPKGALYYVREVNQNPDVPGAVLAAIDHTAKRMTARIPSVAGVSGIRRLAHHVRGWDTKVKDEARRKLLLGHIVRMQEEVGTGGAGFRFMYAAFLQEAAEMFDHEPFRVASRDMTAIGDMWRAKFAGTAVRLIKGRGASSSFDEAAKVLEECAQKEEEVFRFLRANLPSAQRHTAQPALA